MKIQKQSKAEKIASNPTSSILLTLASVFIPGLAVGKDTIDKLVNNIQKERFNTLIDELSKDGIDLTDEIIESEDFIHSSVVILKSVIHTRQRKKIRYFARILKSALNQKDIDCDKLEEFADILDSLSSTELYILQTLYKYESQYYDEQHSDADKYQILGEFWNEFLQTVQNKQIISKDEVIAKLARLNRTGLYRTFTGMYWGYKGDKGQTTSLFIEFATWIELENDAE